MTNQISDEISIPLARISNAYENWKAAPEDRKAFHASVIRRELVDADAALTKLQEIFGDVQMVETAKDAGGCLVMPAPKKDNEIVIEKSARGYKFRLPVAPCADAVRGMKAPHYKISYHEATPDREAYRLFPTETLDDVVGLLKYWFSESYTGTYNRNGGKICIVRVES